LAVLTVLGEALIDLVPVPGPLGTTVLAPRPGGSPYNVAVGTARLGQPTRFAGRLSGDAFGRELRAHLRSSGVDLGAVVDAPQQSTLAVAHVGVDGQAVYEFYRTGTADWAWSAAELDAIAEPSVLHTGSLASWLSPSGPRIAALADRLRTAGRTLLTYDPNLRPNLLRSATEARSAVAAHLNAAHVIKASDEDVSWLTGDRDPATVAQEWLGHGAELVVITRGRNGLSAFSRGSGRVDRPTVPVRVVDTIGAGDAAMAGLLDALIRHGAGCPGGPSGLGRAELAEVLDSAALVAALTCARPGADPPTATELAAAGRAVHAGGGVSQ
jgi:fructokinase